MTDAAAARRPRLPGQAGPPGAAGGLPGAVIDRVGSRDPRGSTCRCHRMVYPSCGPGRKAGSRNQESDLAAIIELQPDIVLANQEENRRIDVERLRAAGVPVWVTVIRTVDEAMASLRTMFRVALAWPEPLWLAQAEQVWQEPVLAPRVRAAIPIWRDPWMVIGSATFTGDIAARLGLDNVYGDHPEHYPHVSLAISPTSLISRVRKKATTRIGTAVRKTTGRDSDTALMRPVWIA